MAGVKTATVADDEGETRLDRWFRRHYPGLTHGRLEKLLRTGQVRVDGHRAKAGQRLVPGQTIRVPPLPAPPLQAEKKPPAPEVGAADAQTLRERVLYKDGEVIALDKPPGLAVQGGTGTRRHLDAMLDALRFDAKDRPRLVHRLDKDTSGVLLLARSAGAAARLADAFRRKETEKLYWALAVGAPRPRDGRVTLSVAKQPGPAGERMVVGTKEGRRALTLYRTIETAGQDASWLALMPVTGRTHQLRAHMAALGTPILGDGKYGGKDAFLQGQGISRKLHLHARRIVLPRPSGDDLEVTAPLPEHMARSFAFFGFDPEDAAAQDPFAAPED